MLKLFISYLIIFSFNATAGNYLEDNLRKENWNGIDVIWLEDNSYPTYSFNIYFDAGAKQDSKGKYGETDLAFNQLTAGTTRYKQKEIFDALEFYGASYGASVTHEYVTYSVGGLVKDMVPTMKMVCHMFSEATFPKNEIEKTKKRLSASLKNMVTSHGELAGHIFRNVSLRGTSFENPVSGTLKSIARITGKDLAKKLKFFNSDVKKRIYITGPSSIKSLKNIIENDCKWTAGSFSQKNEQVEKLSTFDEKKVYLVPVPKANQAQIRIGRYLTAKESAPINEDIFSFASKYMGGGFTSQLMNELRVKRGLTYSAGAYSSSQRNYGRSGISTFTKNETLAEALNVIKETIEKNSKDLAQENFEHSKRFVMGSYLFSLESTKVFLNNLILFDHIGRDYNEIYKYQENISKVTSQKLASTVNQLFDWNKQVKLILGDKKLKKTLESIGYKVEILDYNKFL